MHEHTQNPMGEQGSASPIPEPPPPISDLASFLSESTSDGLFPALTYGMDPNGAPGVVALLTTPIIDLPVALQLVERVHGESVTPYRFVPLNTVKYIADKNAIMRCHVREIPGLDTRLPSHRRAFSRLLAYCTASRWHARAFLLIDMVGFSLMSTPEQLSLRMSLGQFVTQSIKRMHKFGARGVLSPRSVSKFNRTSTGDGFYIWNADGSTEGHVGTFLLMTLLMGQTNALRIDGESPLELRAGFTIGEAYTFPYHGPSVPPPEDLDEGFMPDAIGPALNGLSRLLSAAAPGQILVAPFDQPGRENRPQEKLNIDTMLTRVRSEILPAELEPKDAIKSHDITLQCDPPTPLRITDKHKQVHHCYNVWGKIPHRTRTAGVRLQSVGLVKDDALEVERAAFRSP